MEDPRSKERNGWFPSGSASSEMDNSAIHAKGIHLAEFIAAAVIFTFEYISSHSISQSALEAVIGYIGAVFSLYLYRWIWPKRERNKNDLGNSTK